MQTSVNFNTDKPFSEWPKLNGFESDVLSYGDVHRAFLSYTDRVIPVVYWDHANKGRAEKRVLEYFDWTGV